MRRCKLTAARDWERQQDDGRQGWRSTPSLPSEPDRRLRASRTACLFSFPHENKSRSMTISCISGGLSCFIPKKRLTEPMRLFDLLDRMIVIAGGTGFHAPVLALKFRKDIHACHFAVGPADSDAVCLQC